MSRMDIHITASHTRICVASVQLIDSIEDYKSRLHYVKTEDLRQFYSFMENKQYSGGWYTLILNTDMAHAAVDICENLGYETDYTII